MPTAVPVSRVASFTADATPCLARGREPTMAVVAGVSERAMPAKITATQPRKAR
jgi:hypothetical protein